MTKLTAYQLSVNARMAQPGMWLEWVPVLGFRGRMMGGYLHWFKEGKQWPEYESVPGPSLVKLRDAGFIERGKPEGANVPSFWPDRDNVWRQTDAGREALEEADKCE